MPPQLPSCRARSTPAVAAGVATPFLPHRAWADPQCVPWAPDQWAREDRWVDRWADRWDLAGQWVVLWGLEDLWAMDRWDLEVPWVDLWGAQWVGLWADLWEDQWGDRWVAQWDHQA